MHATAGLSLCTAAAFQEQQSCMSFVVLVPVEVLCIKSVCCMPFMFYFLCDYRPSSSASHQHVAERVQHRPHQPGRALVSTQHPWQQQQQHEGLLASPVPASATPSNFYAAFMSQCSSGSTASMLATWVGCAHTHIQCCVGHCHADCRQNRDTQSLCTSAEAPNPFAIPTDEDLFRLQVCTSRRSSSCCRHQSLGPEASECKPERAWTQPCSGSRAAAAPELSRARSWHAVRDLAGVCGCLRLQQEQRAERQAAKAALQQLSVWDKTTFASRQQALFADDTIRTAFHETLKASKKVCMGCVAACCLEWPAAAGKLATSQQQQVL